MPLTSTQRLRLEIGALVIIVGVSAVLAGAGIVSVPRRDFDEYWSAGDVFLNRGDPYSPTALTASLRQALGEEHASPTMMWNPPWVLPLTVPFAVLPIQVAHLLWVIVQLGLVVISVHLLWRAYEGPRDSGGRLLATALIFPPTVYLLMFGQVGGLCLFGVAGFLYFQSRGRPVPSGLCVALTAIKPHLLFAFGLYLLLDALVSRRSRTAVLAGALAVGLAALLAWIINPEVYANYTQAMTAPVGTEGLVTVREWTLPLASFWLRMWVAPESFWVQFMPLFLVSLITPIIWWHNRNRLDWLQISSALILLSLLAAPYGGWLFDLVLLLVPVVSAAARIGRTHGSAVLSRFLNGVFVMNILVLAMVPLLLSKALKNYIFFTPLIALMYALAMYDQFRGRRSDRPQNRLPLA